MVYATCGVAAPMWATNEATLTIEPPPLASIAGMPCRQPSSVPSTLMSIVVRYVVERRGHRIVVVGDHHAGVVVQDVQPAERLDGVRPRRRDRLLVGHVAAHARGLAAGGVDRLDRLVAVADVGEHDLGALGGEALRADAGRARPHLP